MNRGYLSDKLDEVLTKIRRLDRPDQDPRNFSSGLKTPGQKLRTKNYIIIQN